MKRRPAAITPITRIPPTHVKEAALTWLHRQLYLQRCAPPPQATYPQLQAWLARCQAEDRDARALELRAIRALIRMHDIHRRRDQLMSGTE